MAVVLLLAGCGSGAAADGGPVATPVPTALAPASATPMETASAAPSSSASAPASARPSATQTLRYELDHASSCAALAANFTYISVSSISTSAGQTYVTYQPATMHCGGPDDYQYIVQSGVHHVYVDDDAEVVLIDETDNPTEVASTARDLPAAFARSHQPIFAIRHSSTGQAGALVQRFHP
ncbi:MAG TPA: hypothetical protein VHU88_10035 [Sporichthyaceae bacterium]|nr:hypothetical protein [Sporichthyaceae bacterium]